MSARESAAVERAVAAVCSGVSIAAAAARMCNVARSSIHRALARRASAGPLGGAVGASNVSR